MTSPPDPHATAAVQPAGLSVCVLASGSRGNSIHISDGQTSLLIDAGLSGKELERRMASRHIDPASISAILVSHEHSDHVSAAGVLSRRYGLPLYISPRTHNACTAIGKLDAVRKIIAGRPFSIGQMIIHPFSTSHDACDPVGFTVSANGSKAGIVTDLGVATGMVRNHLKDCGLLLLEANHDREMLEKGPYPWPLKQRIRSRVGHLSNNDARELLGELVHNALEHVILGHLSEENNTPDIARRTVAGALNRSRAELCVALQHECSAVFTLSK